MAKKRRRRTESANPVVFATPRVLSARVLSSPSPGRHLVKKTYYQDVDDRRRHHPLGFFRPAKQLTGHPVKPNVVGRARSARHLPHTINFAAPKATLICVRRKTRKQVLFAKRKTKKGSGAKRHRNWFSSISCKPRKK